MVTPHVAGIAAMIKHSNLDWIPTAIVSAMMTTASTTDPFGKPLRHSVFDNYQQTCSVLILSVAIMDRGRSKYRVN